MYVYVPHLYQVPQEEEKNELDPQVPQKSNMSSYLLIHLFSPRGTFLCNSHVSCPLKGISNENGSVSPRRTQLSAFPLPQD